MSQHLNNHDEGPRHSEPARRVIASYTRYAEAEAAVDYLADRKFPVQRLAIVGQDVKLVEQVTGRLTHLTVAAQGAAAGALPGALIGWLFGLLDWVDPLTSSILLALYGLVFGAILGGLLHLVLFALQRGRRDFTTVSVMQPSRYEILADAEVADQAIRELETRGGASQETREAPPAR